MDRQGVRCREDHHRHQLEIFVIITPTVKILVIINDMKPHLSINSNIFSPMSIASRDSSFEARVKSCASRSTWFWRRRSFEYFGRKHLLSFQKYSLKILRSITSCLSLSSSCSCSPVSLQQNVQTNLNHTFEPEFWEDNNLSRNMY